MPASGSQPLRLVLDTNIVVVNTGTGINAPPISYSVNGDRKSVV